MARRTERGCPDCGDPTVWTKCYTPGCGWEWEPTEHATTDVSPAARDASQSSRNCEDTRSEKGIEAAIMRALELLGWTVYKTSQPQKPVGMSPGIPDLYAMSDGEAAWIEVKRPSGRLTEHQKAFRDDCQRAGVTWFCWRSEAEAIQWAKDIQSNTRRTA